MTTESKDDRTARLEEAIRLKRAASRVRSAVSRPYPEGARLPRRPEGAPARLGDIQQSLWLQHQLDPGSAAYHLVSAFRVSGSLDFGLLARSLEEVVARHRLLRSTFRREGEGVAQVVHDGPRLEIERMDGGESGVVASAVEWARRPFDLEVGPLVRLCLVEGETLGENLVALVLHHILADERSLGQIWREVAARYRGESPREQGEGPQYDDWAYWLSSRQSGDEPESLDFWRQRLDPLPEEMVLPFENRDAVVSARGRLIGRSVRGGAREGVEKVATTAGTTPFVVHAFVFRLLLQRYTEGRPLAFSTPVSTRSHPSTAEMIGYFLNPLVLSARIDEEVSVAKAIADFDRDVRSCMAHASCPFDRLVEGLAPARTRDQHPLFQSMFVYQEAVTSPDLGAAGLEPVILDLGESKFDLTLFVTAARASLEVSLEYRVGRFEQIWMERLLEHYETILANLEAGLQTPVSGLPMLTSREETALAELSRGPALRTASPVLLPKRILERAERSPDAPAVVDAAGEWTYADLERRGRLVAAELRSVGVTPGDRVGLFIDRSRLMIAGILGIHWAGAAYVPLDPSYPAARNRDVLEDAEIRAVATRSSLRQLVPGVSAPVVEIDGVEDRTEGRNLEVTTVEPELPVYLLYTSGSTGRPKGVVVSHRNLAASNAARLDVYDTRPERFLLLPSVAFDSSVAGIFWTLAEGGALVIPSEDEARDPRSLAALIADQGVTTLLCVPSLYAHVLAVGQGRLSALRCAIVAGEACPHPVVEEHFRVVPEARLFNEYGPTEATVWATVHEIEAPDESGGSSGRPVPIGRPIPGVAVEVLDELGRPVPAGIPGEGWISGATVASGYWRRESATEERFGTGAVDGGRTERTFRSGDRLAWNANGRLLFLGRVDDQIKLRGFRVEPGEIESALLALPAVEEAAVVARPEGQLVAFAVTSGPVEDWRTQLASRLPDYMMPSRLVEMPSLPRLPNGKTDRERLKAVEIEAEATASATPLILGSREKALVSLWEGLLGRTGIGLDDNFFQLGGHSLLVVEMTASIEKDLGVTLPPAEVFQNPTVRELSERIASEDVSETGGYSHLFPIEPCGSGAPFIFAIPHFFSEMIATRFRGERPVYGLRGVGLRPEGNRGRWRTMRDLGEELVEEIGRRFPDQPLVVAGYSFGATMAVEAVRLMEERGLPVQRLYLIAPMPLDFWRAGPFRVQIDGLRRPLTELTFGETLRRFLRGNHPFTLRPYRRAWRMLAIQPWRRVLCMVGRLRRLAGLPLTPGILYADVRVERFRLHAGYRPGSVRAPTVIFNAREPATDAAATWRPHFTGPFEAHEISDPHLDEAAIDEAKESILEYLQNLEDGG